MGNAVITCFSHNPQPYKNGAGLVHVPGSGLFSRSNSKKRADQTKAKTNNLSDEVLRQHAVAAALLFQHHQKNGFVPKFTRSASVQDKDSVINNRSKRQRGFSRSSSTGPSSGSDSLLQPHQLNSRVGGNYLRLEELETRHFVLVHGGGFGAWCWYKTMALLQEDGFEVTAVDLVGSGVHSADPNAVSSLADYVKPLTDLLEEIKDGERVILVGHDLGGACISYVMEKLPLKVSKAVFVAAAMVADGQSALDVFSMQTDSNDLINKARNFAFGNGTDQPPTAIEYNKALISSLRNFAFGNGKDQPPTAIEYNKALISSLLFNQSPSKDIALASVSMRPIPFAPITEKLALSDTNYGSTRRFYIQTLDDLAFPSDLQDSVTSLTPPERLFKLKGSDHAPFFSRPQSLHKLLVEISSIA